MHWVWKFVVGFDCAQGCEHRYNGNMKGLKNGVVGKGLRYVY